MSAASARLRREQRLRDSRDYRRLSRRGRRAASERFIVLASRRNSEGGETTRLGITASRKVGGAVVRNRVKRRVREWFRRSGSELEPGLDLVVIARRSASSLRQVDLERELSDLVAEATR